MVRYLPCGYILRGYCTSMSAHLAPSSEMEFETERKFLIEKVFGLAGAGVRSIGSDGGRGERRPRPRAIFAVSKLRRLATA